MKKIKKLFFTIISNILLFIALGSLFGTTQCQPEPQPVVKYGPPPSSDYAK